MTGHRQGEYIDLHIHSRYSDGLHEPEELVRMAADKGLRAVALTDHDTVEGVDEAMAAGQLLKVEVIPAIELSVAFHGFRDVHLLGYFIDHHDRLFTGKLAEFRKMRDERGRAITDRINARLSREKKENIAYDEVLAGAGGTVGRPHIARVLVGKGYAKNIQDAFTRYLQPCYVPKYQIPMAEALAEVRRIGGVAVLAHPPSITADRATLRGMIAELAPLGLEGLEVFTNMCYKNDIKYFNNIALQMGLVATGGSDFHGIEDDDEMGPGRNGPAVPYASLEALRDMLAKRDAG
ncbi:MAG TPA: PHP domain-containing protein [Geobacteraceae bacterium]|nr:PHP domain-containing protein [Geobacteraceae bacterium]